jgi:L-threonylcarbamoyladenylate synthase
VRVLSDSEADLRRAAGALAGGALVAFPTETVYGLGGDAFNPAALARIFEVKRRPRFDPLIIHIADTAGLERVADLRLLDVRSRERLRLLTEALWPGPLTLILPKRPELPELATSGLATAAVRLPAHPAARLLIRLSTGAVAAPSANPFGYLSPTLAEHVAAQLGEGVDYIVDGGRTPVGLESTILDLTTPSPRILRPGGTAQERIEELIGPVETAFSAPALPAAPGQLKSHYAPRTPLFLYEPRDINALAYKPSEAFVFFSGASRDAWLTGQDADPRSLSPAAIQTLSESASLREAAANLFELLHSLDAAGYAAIRVERVPGEGLGAAINDRLSKARFSALNVTH